MKFINFCILQVFMLSVVSCSTKEEASQLLSTYLQNGIYKNGAVIACSASDVISGDVLTFFYPNAGATNFRLFETNSVKDNPNVFSNYKRVNLESEPFFNGYLQKFTQKATSEKWIIVTFQLDNEIKVSNPIRSKQLTKPTVWNDMVSINQDVSRMPEFMWINNTVGDNTIYFQVISDSNNNL